MRRLEGLGVTITRGEPGPFFPNLVVGMAADYGMRGYKIGVDHGDGAATPLSDPDPRRALEDARVTST